MPTFIYTLGRPAGNLAPASQRPDMQTNNDSTAGIVDVDLVGFNNINGGYHKKSTYVAQGMDPGSSINQAVEYSKVVASSTELFLQRDGVASTIQLTRGIPSVAANGYTFLPGGLLLQWGSVVASGAGVPFIFPTPFISAVYSVTLGLRAGAAQASACGIPGLTSVTIYNAMGGGNQTVYVMAIGV